MTNVRGHPTPVVMWQANPEWRYIARVTAPATARPAATRHPSNLRVRATWGATATRGI